MPVLGDGSSGGFPAWLNGTPVIEWARPGACASRSARRLDGATGRGAVTDQTSAPADDGGLDPAPSGQDHSDLRRLYVFKEDVPEDPIDIHARLESLALAMPDMMFRLDAAGRLTEALPAVDEPFAVNPDFFLGRHYSQALPPPVVEATSRAIAEATGGGVVEFEYQLPGPAGVNHYSARMAAVGGGEIVVTVRNVTALRQAQWDLDVFFEMSPDLPVIADVDGRFLRLNADTWKAALGWEASELLGRPYLDFVHPDDRESTTAQAALLASGQDVVGFGNRYRTRSGEYRWLEWRARPIAGTQSILCVARDVTEQRENERRAALIDGISTAVQMSGADTESLIVSITDAVADVLASGCELVLIDDDRPHGKPLGFRQSVMLAGQAVAELVVTDIDPKHLLDKDRTLLREVADRLAPLVANIRIRRHLLETAELVEAAHSGVASVSLTGVVESWNRAAERITGMSADSVVGRDVRSLLRIEAGEDSLTAFQSVVEGAASYHYESEWLRPDGSTIWVDVSMAPVTRGTDSPQAVVMTFVDITDRKDIQTQLANAGRVDPLTTLANRGELSRVLDDYLTTATARAPGSLLFIDLDGFRQLNEQYGQTLGDQVLREVAERLRSASPAGSTVGRLGSDEFGVVIGPDSAPEPEDDLRLAGTILTLVAQPIVLAGEDIRVSGSCGVARFPQDGLTGDELLWRAEAAMEAARAHGGGHAERFRVGMQPRQSGLATETRRLHRGIERNEFLLHYQPLVSSRDGSVVAYEALVRWQQGAGLRSPVEFLEAAEATGAIIPLGYQLIDIGCRWLSDRPELQEVALWLNLSRRQFAAEDLPGRLDQTLRDYAIDSSRVTIEITETTLFHDFDQARATLGALKDLGVGVALDDFGTGQSSLGSLIALPVDAIKIDQGFVAGMDDPTSPGHAIVRAAVEMGHALGLEVVAEGVEREEEKALLIDLGCDLLQGYLFGRPQPEPVPADAGGHPN